MLLRSSDYPRLVATLEAVGAWFLARPEVGERRWPKIKFVVAPGPPGNEHSRWLRAACGLLPATPSTENLQVVMVDQRWGAKDNAAYLMRGVCALEKLPFDLPSLVGNGGKRLRSFVEIFCKQIQPKMHEHTLDPSSPYHGSAVRRPLLR